MNVESRISSKNGWFTPAEAKNYYGRYSREGITVHWWGDNSGADNHDNIVNYFFDQSEKGNKSVNYVVSDSKITCMVEADNVAWASNSGNPTTISIEFQPTLGDQGYRNGGWLIATLEKKYGKLKLYKHSDWVATRCPGTIDLNRLRAEADKGEIMLTRQLIIDEYMVNRGRKPSEKEIEAHLSHGDYKTLSLGFRKENDNFRKAYSDIVAKTKQMQEQINSLSARPTKEEYAKVQASLNDSAKEIQALNEQLAKTVTASAVSLDTNNKITTIFNYFADRWGTFRDFLRRKQ